LAVIDYHKFDLKDKIPMAELQTSNSTTLPDAFIDHSKRDGKDGNTGVIGYEINFNRYFYKYTPH